MQAFLDTSTSQPRLDVSIPTREGPNTPMMQLFRTGASGSITERSIGPYTGEIWREILHNGPGPVVGNVFFTPCARTNWHSHPGGQLLIAVAGRGIVAEAEQTLEIAEGDMVWTPPGVLHWHGGSAEHSLLHTAITLGGVEWGQAVSDEEYENAVKMA